MRRAAMLSLLAALAACVGPPDLPEPHGPTLTWNTGMVGTGSNATVPNALPALAAPTPLLAAVPAPLPVGAP